MAIRSGTGGLKYPLPSMYQIGAQQSAAAASAGGSAAASTFGANRAFAANKMRVQADLANSAAERDFRARSQMEEQGFRAQQNYYDREHQAGGQLEAQQFDADRQAAQFAQQTQLQTASQQFQAGQAEMNRRFTAERDQARSQQEQQAFEREVDAGIEADVRSGKMEIPWEIQGKLNTLEANLVTVKTDPHWNDPQWRAQYIEDYEKRKREYLRAAKPVQGPSKEQDFEQNTMEKDGVLYQRSKNGGWDVLREPQDTSKQDQQRRDEILEGAKQYQRQENPKTGEPYTRKEAIAEAEKDLAELDKRGAPPQQQAPGQAPAPGQPGQQPVPAPGQQPPASGQPPAESTQETIRGWKSTGIDPVQKAIWDDAVKIMKEVNPKTGLPYTEHQAINEAHRRAAKPQGSGAESQPATPASEATPSAGSSFIDSILSAATGGLAGRGGSTNPGEVPQGQTGQSAAGGGHHSLPKNAGKESFDQMPKPMTADERAALPPGTKYMAPDGTVKVKK